jgi:D-alanine-D-alanine ligase
MMNQPSVLLFGGTSSERGVSVASAQNIISTLPELVPLFLAPDGALYWTTAAALLSHQRPFEIDFAPTAPPNFANVKQALQDQRVRGAVCLLALHGGDGENGVLQAQFEQAGVAYTGSDSRASAQAFDKSASKSALSAQGVLVPKGHRLSPMAPAALRSFLNDLLSERPRWVLKPEADGSSVGLIHLRSATQVDQAVETICRLNIPYLAEEFVAGREMTVGVWQHADVLDALPISEVCLKGDATFDFHGKYLAGTEEKTPADVSEKVARQCQHVALAAHQALQCFGYSRTDVIVTSQGPVFLEINTLPGMTRASFIPQQLAAAGIDLADFLRNQLRLAGERLASTLSKPS